MYVRLFRDSVYQHKYVIPSTCIIHHIIQHFHPPKSMLCYCTKTESYTRHVQVYYAASAINVKWTFIVYCDPINITLIKWLNNSRAWELNESEFWIFIFGSMFFQFRVWLNTSGSTCTYLLYMYERHFGDRKQMAVVSNELDANNNKLKQNYRAHPHLTIRQTESILL